MNDKNIRLSELLALYITGAISPQELSELDAITGSREKTDRMAAAVMNDDKPRMDGDDLKELHISTWNSISGRLRRKRRRGKTMALWSGAAAVVIAAGIFMLQVREDAGSSADVPMAVRLLLASGEELELTGGTNLQTPADMIVDNEHKNLIVAAGGGEGSAPSWHTLIVPARNVYNMTLPDGSKVVLNADSRLVFPQRFDDGPRVVYIEGEAYFSVAEDSDRPFIVKHGDFSTTVLGTGFSVKTVGDEYITTLVSGSVVVDNGAGVTRVLVAGQQAVIGVGAIEVREVDVDYYTGWKDGYFVFRGETLAEVVRQLAAWYGLEYSVENKRKGDEKIRARIIRYDDFQDMIGVIEDIRNVSVENGRIVIR